MASDPDKELDERDMIRKETGNNSRPILVWIAISAVIASLLWGGGNWILQKREMSQGNSPFLQVTNRQFSLFLWQFPEYMRTNVSGKSGYLPGFQYVDKVSIEEGQAEAYVSAPPKIIFLYHTWDRLIHAEFPKRPISGRELREFLEYAPEWSPKHWPEAPKEYQTLVATLAEKDGSALDLTSLPIDVQLAVIGWKNYFLEGKMIESYKPTYGELAEFLERFPHYARNYWRNIVMNGRPDYLKGLLKGSNDPKALVPEGELSGFLRVALFNFKQAQKNL